MRDHPETIPATLLPGLLDGWCGPVEEWKDEGSMAVGWTTRPWGTFYTLDLAAVRLPLTRPEARNRLCVVLAARGSPAWHLLPVALGGQLPAEYAHHSAALLACFATRVAAGMGGIVDVLPSWRWISKYGRHWRRGDTLDVRERDVLSEGWHAGWRCRRERCAAGPETGEAGKFAADAAALAAGFALLDEGGVLRLPPITPENP